MEAVDAYLASGPKARAMIEYCVLGGVNDDVAHAAELGELLRGRDVVVNLIPYNPTDVPMGHEPPTEEAVRAMAAVLAKPPYARRTTVRKEMGQDIAGRVRTAGAQKQSSGTRERRRGHRGRSRDRDEGRSQSRGSRAFDIEAGSGRDGESSGLSVSGRRAAERAAKADAPRQRRTHTRRRTRTSSPTPSRRGRVDDGDESTWRLRGDDGEGLNVVAFAACAVLFLASAWKLAILAGAADEL